jgi:hypothetical protein|tara:strand:+ start:806 stop:1027 length:222 start_codon:yes stop_codon:yes gene_type:complete
MTTKPNTNTRFIDTAHEALHMNNDDISHLRMLVSIELLLAEAGITDDQIKLAYENRLRSEISNAAADLKAMID